MLLGALCRWFFASTDGSRRRIGLQERQARLESLEVRALLSAGGPPGTAGLEVDPAHADPFSLLVRFRSEADVPPGWAAAKGTALEERLSVVPRLHKVRIVEPGLTVAEALAAYRSDPNVLYAEPDYRVHVQAVPSDPQFDSLWGLNNTGQSGGTADADIDGAEAWDVTTGSASTVVAVIDTGVDYTHPDLAGNTWVNQAELTGQPGVDDDGNGYVDDVHGYDFVNHDGDPMDDHGHGTHVAGTIGAEGNNGIGVAGINWHTQIMALKFLDASGSGTTSDAIEALNYAVANGAVISNNSWGGDPYSQALYDAIRNARDLGHVFVAAAGNNGADNDRTAFYPAGYDLDNLVAVAATDRNDRLASFSNYGAATVDLAAPGVDIVSTLPNNRYGSNSGTSMAAPHVTGVMALVRGQHPDWAYRQVIDQVLNSVDSLPEFQGRTATGGRLNAARAVGVPDTEGPRIVRSSPSGGVGGPIGSVRLTFQEAIDPASFDSSDISGFTGPNGPIAVVAVSAVDGSSGRQFDVTFAPQSAYGTYVMEIGPQISDLAGNQMDQDRDGLAGEVPDDRYAARLTIGDRAVFSAADVPMSLPALAVSTSTLSVDQDLNIADLDVQVELDYPEVGFLDVSLLSPSGTKISLAPSGSLLGAGYYGTTFDDEAAVPIGGGTSPFSGAYRPASPLSALEGQSAHGTWQLRVQSLWFYSGVLNDWSLSVLANPPRLSIDDVAVIEGDSGTTQAVFTVSLSNPIGAPVTVDYATVDGAATGGSDYAPASGTLTFLPGETTKTIAVTFLGDVLDEPDETFFVNLAGASGATIADPQGQGTICNDEARLSVGDVSLFEGDSGSTSALFVVNLSAASGQTISVSYATANGTAASASDYTAASGIVTFAPGEVSKTIAVNVKGDTANEPDEVFFLDLTGSENALIAAGRGQATVLNDDPVPSVSVGDVVVAEGNTGTKSLIFPVSLSAASGRTVTVLYATADGTATAGEDYVAAAGTLTFAPGQSSRTVAVTIHGDALAEPDETLRLILGAPSGAILLDEEAVGTILNDEASLAIADAVVDEGDAGVRSAYVSVSLSQPMPSPVSVSYATAAGTATAGSDFAPAKGTLTFAPGETSKHIALDVIGDLRNEADETFCVNLTDPSGALLADSQAVVTIRDNDSLPAISVADVELVEGQSGTKNMTFTLALSAVSGRTVTVDYTTADGTALAGSDQDYAAKSGMARISAGAAATTVSIAINGDTLAEDDEWFSLNLSNPAGATLAGDSGSGAIRATGAILDDDTLRIGDVSLLEGDVAADDGVREALFTVNLDHPLSRDVTFDYATSNGTASAGSDYVAASGQAAIRAGDTAVVIPVRVLPDRGDEADESFYLNLNNVEGTVTANAKGVAWILNDDAPPTLSIADVRVAEGNSGTKNATFTLALSAPSGRTVSVAYATVDGTALAGSDYTAKRGTVNLSAGAVTASVSVAIAGETTPEDDETFFLDLSNPVNVDAPDLQAAAVIVNDDPAPCLSIADVKAVEGNSGAKTFVFSVSLSAASTQTISVPYTTANGTAISGGDYTAVQGTLLFSPGQTVKSIAVPVIGDTVPEPDETFFVNLSAPAGAVLLDGQGRGTILSDDTSVVVSNASVTEGGSGTAAMCFTVQLSAPAGHEIRVDYATANSTATAGSDYVAAGGTLTFAPGETTKTVPVIVFGDRIDEADEVLLAKLSNPVGAQIADSQGSGTIFDDDSLTAVSVADVSITEGDSGAKTLSFVLALSAASGRTVTVNYATADGTARAGSDYVAKSGSVNFYAGTTTQTVSITVNGDTASEYDETLLLSLTGASGATITRGQAVGTLLDDDNLTIAGASAAEGDDGTFPLVFTVGLALPLPYEVRVGYTTANGSATAGSDYVVAAGLLVFAPGETTQTVTVLGLGDTADETDETFLLKLSNPVNIVLGDSQATGTILDGDPAPSLSIGDVRVTEGNLGTKNATFTVSLSAASGQTVTVTYATAEGTATPGADYLAAAGTLTFYPGTLTRTFTVTINGDFDPEADEIVLVRLSSPSNATLGVDEAILAILDDDAASEAPAGFLTALAASPQTSRGFRESPCAERPSAGLSATRIKTIGLAVCPIRSRFWAAFGAGQGPGGSREAGGDKAAAGGVDRAGGD